jgi:hypothetical protein
MATKRPCDNGAGIKATFRLNLQQLLLNPCNAEVRYSRRCGSLRRSGKYKIFSIFIYECALKHQNFSF